VKAISEEYNESMSEPMPNQISSRLDSIEGHIERMAKTIDAKLEAQIDSEEAAMEQDSGSLGDMADEIETETEDLGDSISFPDVSDDEF
jgi:hypothetical protein